MAIFETSYIFKSCPSSEKTEYVNLTSVLIYFMKKVTKIAVLIINIKFVLCWPALFLIYYAE